MSTLISAVPSSEEPSFATTLFVRDNCLCLHVQRAARALARRYDDVLRPVGLTSGQFSLLMSLNRPEPPNIAQVATLLAMDRTTLTANIKPLERLGLIEVGRVATDKRQRTLMLTPAGRSALAAAVPLWQRTHDAIENLLRESGPDRLRTDLRTLS
ncbi:MAG TPA: MarR family winged helix-turn-helix transcriptional regulator [Rhodopila sp.]|jgi:DNA-binding MarR family transcriptional regulator